MNHHMIQPTQLKSVIKVRDDQYQIHHKYPSKIFQAARGFVEPYQPEEQEVPQPEDHQKMDFPKPSEMVKMFHPTMSFENDSEYRQLENFDNSSINKSDNN